MGGSRDVSILSNVFIAARDACVRIEPIGLTWRADACAFWGNMSTAGTAPQLALISSHFSVFYVSPPFVSSSTPLSSFLLLSAPLSSSLLLSPLRCVHIAHRNIYTATLQELQ